MADKVLDPAAERRRIRAQKGGRARAKALPLARTTLQSLAGVDGWTPPMSLATLAHKCGCGEPNMRLIVKRLQGEGVLETTGKGTSRKYRILKSLMPAAEDLA